MDRTEQSLTVLLVADDVSIAGLVLAYVGCGHKLLVARDCADALRLAAAYDPDVALLHVRSPDSHGYEVARRLPACANGAKRLVMAVADCIPEQDRDTALAAGIKVFFADPPSPEELLCVHALWRAGAPPSRDAAPPADWLGRPEVRARRE